MKKLNDERGSVLVTAILLLAVMLSLGFAVMSSVDTQTRQSRVERERESTFNLAEASLSAQTFILGRRAPASPRASTRSRAARPSRARTPTSARCPRRSRRATTAPARWTSTSRPPRTAGAPTSATTVTRSPTSRCASGTTTIINPTNPKYASWARYDADGNRHVWVRSEAIVRGRKRAIVAWVRIEDRVINFPQYAVLAGKVGGKNSGGHGGRPLVNSTGSSLGIAVRCTPRRSRPPASTSTRPRGRSSSLRRTSS